MDMHMKESAEQSYLSDADEMKLSERFYFFDTDLFQRIQKEEKRLQETIVTQVVIEEDKELLDKQQSDLDRLRRIQKKLRDEQLDNVKDLLFPASGLIPSLGLLGLANLSVIISPLVTLMFSGAFFCSHIYKKGFNHTLSVLFGISTALGMTSLVLSVIVLTGLAAINPVVVPVLMFATGLLLFFTAVERGRRRQQMVLKTIMPNLRDLLGKFSDVVSKVQQLRQNKDPSDEAVERFVLGKGDVGFGQEDSKLMRGIKQMKSIYVMILFQADHIENLLRTVKNPIEKRQRLKEMKDIIQGIKNGGFPGLDRGIVEVTQ
jgi:phage-related protein